MTEARVAVKGKPSETAWLVENIFMPNYLKGMDRHGSVYWTTNHLEAVRFARKEDAEKFQFGDETRVVEHAWDF